MDRNNPYVSIIVPVYNVQNFLCRCIDSILVQSFPDFELILVDDESPDSCGTICDRYASSDQRIRVIHRKNGGVSAARNTGLDAASGKYIAFCDGDDYWAPDMLQTLVNGMETNNADVVVSGFLCVSEEGTLLDTVTRVPSVCRLKEQAAICDYLIQNILSKKEGWEVWSRLFKKSIIEQHGIRFCTTCGNYAEDMGFVLQYCLYIESACSMEYCGYYYLIRQNSMMRNSEQVVKLEQTNVVSRYIGEAFRKDIQERKLRMLYPVIHFLMMQNEYLKLIRSDRYHMLPQEIAKITNKKWYYRQTRRIFFCYRYLQGLYGKRTAQRILLLSHFCSHGNWTRFCYESTIAYRWFIKGE